MAIAGPMSRGLLARMTRDDVSGTVLRFCDYRRTTVAGVPVLLARMSFFGELGYEMSCAPQFQLKLFETIWREGADPGLKIYGARALMSLCLEKNRGFWTLENRPDFTATESGLDAFVAFDKDAPFIGCDAALAECDRGPSKRLVALDVDAADVDCSHDEAVFHDGACVGYVTSGRYAHYSRQGLATAYAPSALARDGERFEVEILGGRRPARLQAEPLYDPSGSRMRF